MAVDPNIKKKADDIRTKIKGKEVRESLASGLEAMSTDVVENTGRQDNVESQFQDVIENTTDKDVISAPEIIAARNGEPNLKTRIDKDHQEVTAQLAQKANNTFFESTVFTRYEDFNSNWFRIPFLTTTNNGTIIAGGDIRYTGGSDWATIDIGIARSIDGGKTWIDKKIIIENNKIDLNHSRAMDGTIIYDTNTNRIYVFAVKLDDESNWFTKNTKENWDVVYVTSDDEGKTWSDEKSIAYVTDSFANREVFMQGVGSGIVMKDGTIVLPVQTVETDNPTTSPDRMQATIVYSKDNGTTWQMGESLIPEPSSENNVVELTNGPLLLNARQQDGDNRILYTSNDLGSTWNPVDMKEPLWQSYPTMGSMIKSLSSGGKDRLLFSHPYSTTQGGRYDLSLLYSDDGSWWGVAGVVQVGLSDGYSSLSYHENKLYVLIEYNGNLVFKDISKLLTVTEQRKPIVKTISNIRQNFWVSNDGNDTYSGNERYPLKTINEVFKRAELGYGNTINVYVMSDISGNIKIEHLKDIAMLNITGVGGIRKIDNIHLFKNNAQITFKDIELNGNNTDVFGSLIDQSKTIVFTDCTFSSGVQRLLRVSYSDVILQNPTFIAGQTVDQRAIDGAFSKIDVDKISLTGTFLQGFVMNGSYLNLRGEYTTNDTLLSNSLIPIREDEKNLITNTFKMEISNYQNEWSENANDTFKGIVNGHQMILTGIINSGSLSNGTTIAEIEKFNPLYDQHVLVVGAKSDGTRIPVTLKITKDGKIQLAQNLTTQNIGYIQFVNNAIEIEYL